MDTTFLGFAVLAFLSVVLVMEGLYNLWAARHGTAARRISQRLAALQGELRPEAVIERRAEEPRFAVLHALIGRSGAGRSLVRWVRASGEAVTPGELMVLSTVLAAAGVLLPVLLGRPMVLGLALAALLAVAPWWRIARLRDRRVARFEAQFPEALDLLSRAMRAGHALPTAVRMAGEELAEPLGREFRLLSDETNYGVPMSEALGRMSERVPLADLSFFAVAVMIQRESGGNLAEVLDKISSIVRERLKLMGEIRTLSAEGRLSALILTGLPFAAGFLVNLVNPTFMQILWVDPLGLRMVGLSLFMMVVGIVWMRRIIRIRV